MVEHIGAPPGQPENEKVAHPEPMSMDGVFPEEGGNPGAGATQATGAPQSFASAHGARRAAVIPKVIRSDALGPITSPRRSTVTSRNIR